MNHIHGYHIGTAIIVIIGASCMYMAKDFLREVLSQKDPVSGKSFGSHKRVIEFLLILTMCYCEIFHVLKKGELDKYHLIIFVLTSLLYAGITNFDKMVAALKGRFTSFQTIETPEAKATLAQTTTQPAGT